MPGKSEPRATPPAQNTERTVTSRAEDADRLAASRATDDIQRLRPVARGQPAPLTQSEIEMLARGQTSPRIAERLASRPLERVDRPEAAAAAVFAPMKVEAEDLKALAETGTAAGFDEALERSAAMPGRFGETRRAEDSGKAAPGLEPEG